MSPLPRPCARCGEPITERCTTCTPPRDRSTELSASARGYDAAHVRLRTRVLALTDVCSDAHLGPCAGPMTLDHRPIAWQRKALGLTIRLQDVDAVCLRHNNIRGAARGDHVTRTD